MSYMGLCYRCEQLLTSFLLPLQQKDLCSFFFFFLGPLFFELGDMEHWNSEQAGRTDHADWMGSPRP